MSKVWFEGVPNQSYIITEDDFKIITNCLQEHCGGYGNLNEFDAARTRLLIQRK